VDSSPIWRSVIGCLLCTRKVQSYVMVGVLCCVIMECV